MSEPIVTQLFSANLSFSALLLAVEGILISLYIRAEHERWRSRFRILIVVCALAFFMGLINSTISFLYILEVFSYSPELTAMVFALIVDLFLAELVVLGFAGLLLVWTLVRG
jgi:hypothetical protein